MPDERPSVLIFQDLRFCQESAPLWSTQFSPTNGMETTGYMPQAASKRPALFTVYEQDICRTNCLGCGHLQALTVLEALPEFCESHDRRIDRARRLPRPTNADMLRPDRDDWKESDRPMAIERKRWDALSILNLARGFQESRILLTAVELDVFSRLSEKAKSATDVARQVRTNERAMTKLLDALTAMDLLTKRQGVYSTPASVRALLTSDSRQSVLPMALHSAFVWRSWDHLTDVVRTGKRSSTQTRQRDKKDLESFIHAMRVIASPRVVAQVKAMRPGKPKRILDVGAGPATYTIALLNECPGARATVFDLPPVIAIARKELRQAGVLSRVSFVAGDFYTDSLPEGHDLALLSAIIHQNSRKENVELYRRIRDALVPGGRLIIRDHVMDPARIRPRAGALFAINMLVNTEGGDTYTFREIREDLESAGFSTVRQTRKGEMMDSLVKARKPKE